MFYNVENLFDIYDDSLTNDNEFLPYSVRNWTYERFKEKINNIYKIIIATGGWKPPEIIGLCEIENKYVLNELVNNTPFSKFRYKIIHGNSPDTRGIDVAMLYNEKSFKVLNKCFININFIDDPTIKTRQILYVKGTINKSDTLHIFINHWPSRRGGQLQSEYKRVYVANVLKTKTDSILEKQSKAKIIIMGDFNDNPTDKSLQILSLKNTNDSIYSNQLYNLSNELYNNGKGSYKYQGEWLLYDQFIVSESLIKSQQKIYCKNMYIVEYDLLLEEDKKYFGLKPKRTYLGYKYNGGFSDHLTVYVDINFNE